LNFSLRDAAFDVPLTTLTSLLPRHADERERYVRVRMFAGTASRVLVTGLNAYVASWWSDRMPIVGWIILGVLSASIVASAAALALAVGRTDGGPRELIVPVAGGSPESPDVVGLRSLLSAFLIATAILPTLSRLVIFVDAEGAPASGSMLLLAFSVGSAIGPFVVAPLKRRAGRLPITTVVSALAALSAMGLGATLIGRGLPMSVLAALSHGVALGTVGTLLWSRAAALAAERAGRPGRTGSMVFGAVTACIQVSVALGTLILAPLIDAVAHGDGVMIAIAACLSGPAGLALVLAGPTVEGARRLRKRGRNVSPDPSRGVGHPCDQTA
jgi:Na+/melibiose symporter-like transporter